MLCQIKLHTKGLSLHILLTAFFSLSVQFILFWKTHTHTHTLIWVSLNFKISGFKPFFFFSCRDVKFSSIWTSPKLCTAISFLQTQRRSKDWGRREEHLVPRKEQWYLYLGELSPGVRPAPWSINLNVGDWQTGLTVSRYSASKSLPKPGNWAARSSYWADSRKATDFWIAIFPLIPFFLEVFYPQTCLMITKQDRNTTWDNFALVCTCSFTPTPPNNCSVLDVFQLCFSFRCMYNTPCALHRSPRDERMLQNEFVVFLTWRKALLSALFHTHICLWDCTYFSLNELLWLNAWGEGRKKRNCWLEIFIWSLGFKLPGGSESGEKGEPQRAWVQEYQKQCWYPSHTGCSFSFPRWHFSNSTAGVRVPSQGSWAITVARATPRAVVTSVRYITKVQGGSNVALLDATPNGSNLMQDCILSIWPHLSSFGVKSSFSS